MAYNYEVTENPEAFKDQILRIWDENLPETPPSRYEWLTSGNPAGKTKWILALDKQKNILTGLITILPRQFIWKGKKLLFGIMGDFAVDKGHRGFGPGQKLPRYALEWAGNNGFSLIYTTPYYGTVKHFERAGFKDKLDLHWLIKPLAFDQYIKNTVSAKLLNIAAFIIDSTFRLLLLNSVVLEGRYFKTNNTVDTAFDTFWERLDKKGTIIGSRNSMYLNWRYMRNPLNKFQVLTLRKRGSEELLGYVMYTINDGKLSIFDLQSFNLNAKNQLIQRLIQIARKKRCNSLYLLTSEVSPEHLKLNKFGFIHREEKHPLCYAPLDSELTLDAFQFFQGDRNV